MNDIYWMRTNDLWGPDSGLEADFCAIDPERPGATERERYIGRVYQYPHGPEKGLWFWSMTCTHRGPASRSRRMAARKGGGCRTPRHRVLPAHGELLWRPRPISP
jgi:hypothetical protein